MLASAILAGASAQLRHMASTGGNLLQRTRCLYFYDVATPCNKREPGSGCSANGGLNRMNAILGTSDACIAVHPSDMYVALAVLEANVHVTGRRGERVIAFADFHRLPADTPQRDTNLDADELVTSIELPPRGFATNYTYLKIRDRLSYAFALVYHARRGHRDVAIRGFPSAGDRPVRSALPMRQCAIRAQAYAARSRDPVRYARAQRRLRRLCARMRDG